MDSKIKKREEYRWSSPHQKGTFFLFYIHILNEESQRKEEKKKRFLLLIGGIINFILES